MITPANARALVRARRYALRTGNRVAAAQANALIVQYIEQHEPNAQTRVIFDLMDIILNTQQEASC